ncbi:MAG: hypothetical protein ABIB71_09290 [Candidatus Woesearchaeota archaeon]
MLNRIYHMLLEGYGRQGWWPLSGDGKRIGKDHDNYQKVNPKGDDYHNWPRHLGILPKTEKQKLEICVGAILTQYNAVSY